MTPERVSTRDLAEFFRLGLLGGLVPTRDAIFWADELVASSARPDAAIVDLAVAGVPGRLAAISALSEFQGVPGPLLPIQLLLAWCYRLAVVGQRDEFGILSALLGLPLDENTRYHLDAIEDAFTLAVIGHAGTLDEARRRFQTFLSEFAKYEQLLP